MDRIDFQIEFTRLLDKALDNLSVKEFDKRLERLKEILEDYK